MPERGWANMFYPVYIAIDVSDSMQVVQSGESTSAHDYFQLLIADLVLTLQDRLAIRTSVWLSIIAFSTEPHLVLPLTRMLQPFPVAPLPRHGQTNLAGLLALLDATIRQDRLSNAGSGTFGCPLVFVVTDGQPMLGRTPQPMSAWLPTRDRLGSAGARIAALGLAGADETVLWKLATGQRSERNAFIAQPDQPMQDLAENVAAEIIRSIGASVQQGDMVIRAPRGMRRVGA